jgi:hypothetical protein
MKGFGLIIISSLLLIALTGCGKETTDNSSEESVVLTPGLKTDEDNTTAQNNKFKVSVQKSIFQADEIIVITVENIGGSTLNHLGFTFEGAPSVLSISRINCFDIIEPAGKCRFAGVYSEVQQGYQEIKILYDNFGAITEEVIYFQVQGEILPDTHHFLFEKRHTKADCNRAKQFQRSGFVTSIGTYDYCTFRGVNYYESESSPVEDNPLAIFKSGIEVDKFYCPADWKLASMTFDKSIVQEKKNILGQTREVTIPAGESREVCVKWGIFSCKEKKVFYSRLTKVNCY